jgi:hypothetical protein
MVYLLFSAKVSVWVGFEGSKASLAAEEVFLLAKF